MSSPHIWAILDFPPHLEYPSGFSPRAHHLLKAVAQTWPLNVVALNRSDSSWDESTFLPDNIAVQSLFSEAIGSNPLYEPGLKGRLRRGYHYGLGKRSGMAYPERLPSLRKCITEETAQLALFFLPHVAHLAFDLPTSVPCVYVLEEGLERSYSQVAPEMPRWKRNWLDATEKARARRLYRQIRSRGGQVVAISEEEKEWFLQFLPEHQITVIPHGIDCSFYQPSTDAPSSMAVTQDIDVAMFGGLGHKRNYEPMVELYSHFQQEPRATQEKLIWAFVGSDPNESLQALKSPTTFVPGFVPDVRPFYQRSKVVVVPARRGGGVKTTMLQAWAMRRPVVATSFALNGLPARPGENVLVGDTTEELARHISTLLNSPELSSRMAQAGRETVCRERDVKVIAAQFVQLCADVISNKSVA